MPLIIFRKADYATDAYPQTPAEAFESGDGSAASVVGSVVG
jgi:hypothetical protein